MRSAEENENGLPDPDARECENCGEITDENYGDADEWLCEACGPEDPRDRADREGRTHS